jgi:hypothetical protein
MVQICLWMMVHILSRGLDFPPPFFSWTMDRIMTLSSPPMLLSSFCAVGLAVSIPLFVYMYKYLHELL